MSDYPIIWYGPPNLSTYAIGKDINQNLSKSDRIFIVHTTSLHLYNLKIQHFSVDDRGKYKCARRGPDNKPQDMFFNLEIKSKINKTFIKFTAWKVGYACPLKKKQLDVWLMVVWWEYTQQSCIIYSAYSFVESLAA